MPDNVHILGIRHHGPGSARSVLRALNELHPDCVLIEGPPDADAIIPFAASEQMQPPVAILVHDTADPSSAVYYPFAEFSPEWQAIRWALGHGAAVRFMDLPQSHRMAVERARLEKPIDESTDRPPGVVHHDPLQQLAEAAGFDDGERWWEHVVEHRTAEDANLFLAIRDAMGELRASTPPPSHADEPLREAWMRRTIREAIKGGAQTIAVVCGAWHAPALDVDTVTKKSDDLLLKDLPKCKTSATWVPWTYDHLTLASGYGAGVHSPGWYDHLWRRDSFVVHGWMTRVAHLLRAQDIDCSSAHVIEAVRLSETLAAMRGRPIADLSDLTDATRAVFCSDTDLPMRLIALELLVGHVMGGVPDDTPMVPLQQDLIAQQRKLRLKPEAMEKLLDLDLRNETDRNRSVLLHRLRLLGLDWGTPAANNRGGKGTFHENWQLRWEPGFVVRLIQAGSLGNTIETASGAALAKLAAETKDLRQLSSRLQDAMLADLDDASRVLVKQIENVAAVATEVTLLMQTLPGLTSLVRYGNVRQTDEHLVRHIINGIVPRITAGLGGAVASLNDEAAEAMERHVRAVHDSIEQLDDASHKAEWQDALARILEHDTVHGLIRGRCTRLLLDSARIDAAEVSRRLHLTLSPGTDPAHGARWLEGFLRGSGLLLIHDAKLLSIIDGWVLQIRDETFEELLPLLRRTFTTFPAAERRQIGQMLAAGPSTSTRHVDESNFNHERAAKALPLLLQILGGQP